MTNCSHVSVMCWLTSVCTNGCIMQAGVQALQKHIKIKYRTLDDSNNSNDSNNNINSRDEVGSHSSVRSSYGKSRLRELRLSVNCSKHLRDCNVCLVISVIRSVVIVNYKWQHLSRQNCGTCASAGINDHINIRENTARYKLDHTQVVLAVFTTHHFHGF
jgi:hypothetical protein